jgi:hypothetical protein
MVCLGGVPGGHDAGDAEADGTVLGEVAEFLRHRGVGDGPDAETAVVTPVTGMAASLRALIGTSPGMHFFQGAQWVAAWVSATPGSSPRYWTWT